MRNKRRNLIGSFLAGRDDKTRTCDLAPPRRVRYQLRYIPFLVVGAKVRTFFVMTKYFSNFVPETIEIDVR